MDSMSVVFRKQRDAKYLERVKLACREPLQGFSSKVTETSRKPSTSKPPHSLPPNFGDSDNGFHAVTQPSFSQSFVSSDENQGFAAICSQQALERCPIMKLVSSNHIVLIC